MKAWTPAAGPPAALTARVDVGHRNVSHSTKKRTGEAAIPSRARSAAPSPGPAPGQPPQRTAPQEDWVGAGAGRREERRWEGGGVGETEGAGQGLRAPPARSPSLLVAGGRARGTGCGGRAPGGPGQPVARAPARLCLLRGRLLRTQRASAAFPQPVTPGSRQRSSAPCSAVAAPRTNRNRPLAPELPGAPPAPALRNRGRPPGRCRPLRPPCALALVASLSWLAPGRLVGVFLSSLRRTSRRPANAPAPGSPPRRRARPCPAPRTLAVRLWCAPGRPGKGPRFQSGPELSRSAALPKRSAVCQRALPGAARTFKEPRFWASGSVSCLSPACCSCCRALDHNVQGRKSSASQISKHLRSDMYVTYKKFSNSGCKVSWFWESLLRLHAQYDQPQGAMRQMWIAGTK